MPHPERERSRHAHTPLTDLPARHPPQAVGRQPHRELPGVVPEACGGAKICVRALENARFPGTTRILAPHRGTSPTRTTGSPKFFDWYFSGDVDVPTASTTSGFTFHVSAPSADHLMGLMAEVGAMLTGRRTFERADGWDGQHPWDVPAFVATHHVPDGWPLPGSTVQFVTDGIESAVARAKTAAAPKSVGVHGAQTIQQCLDAGLLDEIHIDLAAVLLGAGVRLFDDLANTRVVLGPAVVTGVARGRREACRQGARDRIGQAGRSDGVAPPPRPVYPAGNAETLGSDFSPPLRPAAATSRRWCYPTGWRVRQQSAYHDREDACPGKRTRRSQPATQKSGGRSRE
jgi:dihydrofolate reductase